MPTIQSLRPKGHVMLVVLDDSNEFRCGREFARRSGLRRGQQIDDVILARLRAQASRDLARAELARLRRKRRYSNRELVQRLRQAGIPSQDIYAALEAEGADNSPELEVAARVVDQAWHRETRRDPSAIWSEFRRRQAGRMSLRGFAPGVIAAALERAAESVAHDRLRAYPDPQKLTAEPAASRNH